MKGFYTEMELEDPAFIIKEFLEAAEATMDTFWLFPMSAPASTSKNTKDSGSDLNPEFALNDETTASKRD